MTLDVVATAAGDDVYALRVELANPGPEALEVSTYEPFLAFSIAATAGGAPVTVHMPALDIPVNPVTLKVPAGGALTLHPPLHLRIAAGASPGDDGFVWTIPHAREEVALELRLELPAPFDLSSSIRLP